MEVDGEESLNKERGGSSKALEDELICESISNLGKFNIYYMKIIQNFFPYPLQEPGSILNFNILNSEEASINPQT